MKLEDILKSIKPLDDVAMKKASERLDNLIKPLGSLGTLEKLAIKLAGISGKINNNVDKSCTIIMCSDNGVVAEGVASAPQKVTLEQTLNFPKLITGIGVISKSQGMDIKVVDIGVNGEVHHKDILNRKIAKGTKNLRNEAAMSKEEGLKAIEVGFSLVKDLVKAGYTLLGTGEMGIGNTTTSSAITYSILDTDIDMVVGRGGGLTDEGLILKKNVIKEAIINNQVNVKDPLEVLYKVGGFDIAGIVGCYLGAAYFRVPIIIDGFISITAALLAYKLNPLVREYMIPSHISQEPGYKLIMEYLNLKPMIDLDMRLGEGTGCPIAKSIVSAACSIINEMATFEESKMRDDYLIDNREE